MSEVRVRNSGTEAVGRRVMLERWTPSRKGRIDRYGADRFAPGPAGSVGSEPTAFTPARGGQGGR